MNPLLPEMTVRSTVGPALAPVVPASGAAALVPGGEGGGSGFAALLDAALPSPVAPPLPPPPVPEAPELLIAGADGRRLFSGTEREAPLAPFSPAAEPTRQPVPPVAPRLPTGRILPPQGAVLPPPRLAYPAAPEALPGTMTTAPQPVLAGTGGAVVPPIPIPQPAAAPDFKPAPAAALLPRAVAAEAPPLAPTPTMVPQETRPERARADAPSGTEADCGHSLLTVPAMTAAPLTPEPAAERDAEAAPVQAPPLAAAPKHARPHKRIVPESLPGAAEPLALPVLALPGESGMSLVSTLPVAVPADAPGPAVVDAAPTVAPGRAVSLAVPPPAVATAAAPQGLSVSSAPQPAPVAPVPAPTPAAATPATALPPAPGQTAPLPVVSVPPFTDTGQSAVSAALAAAAPLMASAVANAGLRAASPAPVAAPQSKGGTAPMLVEVLSPETPRLGAAPVPVTAASALDPAAAAELAAALPEARPSDAVSASPVSSSGTAPAVPPLHTAPPAPLAPALAERTELRPATPVPSSTPDSPQQQSTIDQVGDLREALRARRPALTLNHAEFGAISVRLEAGGSEGWRAVLASRDPAFVPAIHAALAERAAVAASAPVTECGNSPAGQSGALPSGAGDQRSGSSPNGGQASPQPYLGQSGSRDGEAAPDHRRPSTAAALAARTDADDEGSGGQSAPSGGLFA